MEQNEVKNLQFFNPFYSKVLAYCVVQDESELQVGRRDQQI